MEKLKREDLFSLERYAEVRPEFRAKVLEHKKHRQVPVGPNATLYFEDRLTMQYQVQEMLRVERIFEAEGIEEELAAYNPLIPDGSNWKVTFMIEYPDESERRERLAALRGIEEKTYVQVEGFDRVYPIANEDLERSNEEKTSSVHFMRFELSPEMVRAVKAGSNVAMGIEHPEYSYRVDAIPAPAQRNRRISPGRQSRMRGPQVPVPRPTIGTASSPSLLQARTGLAAAKLDPLDPDFTGEEERCARRPRTTSANSYCV